MVSFDAGRGEDGAMTSDPFATARACTGTSRTAEPVVPPDTLRRPWSLPESAVKFTRAAALWSALIVGFVILILLLVFIMQNTDSATVHFIAWEWNLPDRRGGSAGCGVWRRADLRGGTGADSSASPRGQAESEGRPLAR